MNNNDEYNTSYAKSLAPGCVRTQSRICFALAWFDTEKAAKAYAKVVRAKGSTYNGGYFHGSPLGRNTAFDYDDAKLGKRLYAVTY